MNEAKAKDLITVYLPDVVARYGSDCVNALIAALAAVPCERCLTYESAEASVCPEDVGFVEYIGSLRARIAELKQERDEARSEAGELARDSYNPYYDPRIAD